MILLTPFMVEASNDRDPRFGLSAPQPQETMPQTKSLPSQTFRRTKQIAGEIVKQIDDNIWELSEGWKLTDCDNVVGCYGALFSNNLDTTNWFDAVVPGTVLTSLVEYGIYPDPYYGLDNLAIPDSLCRKEWWYRLAFDNPILPKGRKAWVQFDGINYRADIWLNSRKLGNMAGAFSRGRYEVTDLLGDSNVLAVKIYPPYNPGIPHEQSMAAGQGHNGGVLCLDGPTFICSEGWDWLPGIRDRNIGIWQPVTLKYTGDVIVDNPQIITDLPLPRTDYADINIKATVSNTSDAVKKTTVMVSLEGRKLFETPLVLDPHATYEFSATSKDYESLRIYNPRLWWPNGYGEQELYDLEIAVLEEEQVSDNAKIRFGIREYSYILSVDDNEDNEIRIEYFPTNDVVKEYPFDSSYRRSAGEGGVVVPRLKESASSLKKRMVEKDGAAPYLVICCNGVRIFCRGGNWGMDDGMKRVSRDRLEPAMKFHKEQGFNMIRNWTGETTEELFYTLCDEYGMMVWNDFWLSTEGANLEAAEDNLFVDNATETVRRFRNHPSIAVWCPRNEGYAPASLDKRLSEMIAIEDGTRHYNPNSRYMNLRTSGPWHYLMDQNEYYTTHAKGFTTELGSPAVPTAESMKKFIPESEQWPISDTWCYHDLHDGLPHYCNSIDSLYGKSSSLDEFCMKAQMINYDSYRTMFEAWNSKMWNSTSGMLLWMSHPAWPSVEWQTYSWDLETPGAYFGSKKACEPIHVQMNQSDNKLYIVNTTTNSVKSAKVIISQYDMNGQLLSGQIQVMDMLGSNAVTAIPLEVEKFEDRALVRLELFSKGKKISQNDYWILKDGNYRYLNTLPNANIAISKISRDSEGKLRFEVTNKSAFPAIAVKFNIRDRNTGNPVLPAYFSDGYINLLPNETRQIRVDFDYAGKTSVSAEGYNFPRANLAEIN